MKKVVLVALFCGLLGLISNVARQQAEFMPPFPSTNITQTAEFIPPFPEPVKAY